MLRRRAEKPGRPCAAAAAAVVSEVGRSVRGMIIDCGTCTVRGDACADCVVTFLTIPVRAGAGEAAAHGGDVLGDRAASPRHAAHSAPSHGAAAARRPAAASASDPGAGGVDLDDAERAAIAVLAGQGLVPPLRLVRAV